MIDVAFWLQWFIPILVGLCLAIMILISVVAVELKQFKKRRKENQNESS